MAVRCASARRLCRARLSPASMAAGTAALVAEVKSEEGGREGAAIFGVVMAVVVTSAAGTGGAVKEGEAAEVGVGAAEMGAMVRVGVERVVAARMAVVRVVTGMATNAVPHCHTHTSRWRCLHMATKSAPLLR